MSDDPMTDDWRAGRDAGLEEAAKIADKKRLERCCCHCVAAAIRANLGADVPDEAIRYKNAIIASLEAALEKSNYYVKTLAHAERTENHLPPKLRAELDAFLANLGANLGADQVVDPNKVI